MGASCCSKPSKDHGDVGTHEPTDKYTYTNATLNPSTLEYKRKLESIYILVCVYLWVFYVFECTCIHVYVCLHMYVRLRVSTCLYEDVCDQAKEK